MAREQPVCPAVRKRGNMDELMALLGSRHTILGIGEAISHFHLMLLNHS